MDINQDGSIEWTEFRNFLSQEVRLHTNSRRCTSFPKVQYCCTGNQTGGVLC